MGQLSGLEKFVGEGLLFWIDKLPDANFGHSCEQVLVGASGQITRAEHHWPPEKQLFKYMTLINQ